MSFGTTTSKSKWCDRTQLSYLDPDNFIVYITEDDYEDVDSKKWFDTSSYQFYSIMKPSSNKR